VVLEQTAVGWNIRRSDQTRMARHTPLIPASDGPVLILVAKILVLLVVKLFVPSNCEGMK